MSPIFKVPVDLSRTWEFNVFRVMTWNSYTPGQCSEEQGMSGKDDDDEYMVGPCQNAVDTRGSTAHDSAVEL